MMKANSVEIRLTLEGEPAKILKLASFAYGIPPDEVARRVLLGWLRDIDLWARCDFSFLSSRVSCLCTALAFLHPPLTPDERSRAFHIAELAEEVANAARNSDGNGVQQS